MNGGSQTDMMYDFIPDDFASVMICAIRYSLGRMTYMPSVVCRFVKPKLAKMSKKDLYVIIRDIEECRDYGQECDEECWKDLLEEAKRVYESLEGKK
jgi:hypothetical protein